MADVSSTAGTATVTDRRPVPQGVLPRRMQAWLMASVAAGMVPDHCPRGTTGTGGAPKPSDDACRRVAESRSTARVPRPLTGERVESGAGGPNRRSSATAAHDVHPGARGSVDARPRRVGAQTTRVREPVRQQRGAEPSTGLGAAGVGASDISVPWGDCRAKRDGNGSSAYGRPDRGCCGPCDSPRRRRGRSSATDSTGAARL